jgi:hypothetical protein
MKITNKTLRETTQEWMESQGDWIENALFAPALSQLLLLADGIDASPQTASLHAQFGLVYRNLIAERPKDDSTEDALDALLGGFPKMEVRVGD